MGECIGKGFFGEVRRRHLIGLLAHQPLQTLVMRWFVVCCCRASGAAGKVAGHGCGGESDLQEIVPISRRVPTLREGGGGAQVRPCPLLRSTPPCLSAKGCAHWLTVELHSVCCDIPALYSSWGSAWGRRTASSPSSWPVYHFSLPPLFALLLFRSLFLSFVPINWLINERAVQSSGGNLESFVLLKLAVLEHNPYLRVRIIGSIAKGTYPPTSLPTSHPSLATLSSPRPSLTARGK